MQGGSATKVGSGISQDALLSMKTTEQRNPGHIKKFKCHYCKRRGHFVRDSFKKKADEKQNKNPAEAHRIEIVQNYDDNNDDNPEVALVIDHNLPQCDGCGLIQVLHNI